MDNMKGGETYSIPCKEYSNITLPKPSPLFKYFTVLIFHAGVGAGGISFIFISLCKMRF